VAPGVSRPAGEAVWAARTRLRAQHGAQRHRRVGSSARPFMARGGGRPRCGGPPRL